MAVSIRGNQRSGPSAGRAGAGSRGVSKLGSRHPCITGQFKTRSLPVRLFDLQTFGLPCDESDFERADVLKPGNRQLLFVVF
jgi:hypothetical protein